MAGPHHHSPDHYATLGVADSAPHAVIQAAYRQRIRHVHPDVAGHEPTAAARALEVNAAWALLKDPVARAGYDRQRAAGAAPRPVAGAAGVPSWGPGGVRPVTIQQLREAAARESAYSEVGRRQRDAFSAASRRLGVAILLVGLVLLVLTGLR